MAADTHRAAARPAPTPKEMRREQVMNRASHASGTRGQKSRAKFADGPGCQYVAFGCFDIGRQVRASMEALSRSYDLLDATARQAESRV